MKMNHKIIENTCHGAEIVQFFEMNHAGSIAAN